MTTTLVLGNAFDKEYWSPQGIPQDGRNGKIFVSYLLVIICPEYFQGIYLEGRETMNHYTRWLELKEQNPGKYA